MSDEWRHPTMADAGYNEEVRCKCKRKCQPCDMYDVRSLGVGDDYRCSACVESFFRKGICDRLKFYRLGGANQVWLDNHKQKLLRGPLNRTGLTPEIWGEILANHIDEQLPPEARWGALMAAEHARKEADHASPK